MISPPIVVSNSNVQKTPKGADECNQYAGDGQPYGTSTLLMVMMMLMMMVVMKMMMVLMLLTSVTNMLVMINLLSRLICFLYFHRPS
jgi:hypothetical protein